MCCCWVVIGLLGCWVVGLLGCWVVAWLGVGCVWLGVACCVLGVELLCCVVLCCVVCCVVCCVLCVVLCCVLCVLWYCGVLWGVVVVCCGVVCGGEIIFIYTPPCVSLGLFIFWLISFVMDCISLVLSHILSCVLSHNWICQIHIL